MYLYKFLQNPPTGSEARVLESSGLFSAILGKDPKPKLGKKDRLGEINDIEHNKGSKIYPQNQVILDYIMPSIPLKHKCLSIIFKYHSDMSHCFS